LAEVPHSKQWRSTYSDRPSLTLSSGWELVRIVSCERLVGLLSASIGRASARRSMGGAVDSQDTRRRHAAEALIRQLPGALPAARTVSERLDG
jgi:hypothetical protein